MQKEIYTKTINKVLIQTKIQIEIEIEAMPKISR